MYGLLPAVYPMHCDAAAAACMRAYSTKKKNYTGRTKLTSIAATQLGIPTANIPADDLSEKFPDLTTGVYYGAVALDPTKFKYEGQETEKPTILPAVLSIGYNPFYKNTVRSVVRPNPLLSSHLSSPFLHTHIYIQRQFLLSYFPF